MHGASVRDGQDPAYKDTKPPPSLVLTEKLCQIVFRIVRAITIPIDLTRVRIVRI